MIKQIFAILSVTILFSCGGNDDKNVPTDTSPATTGQMEPKALSYSILNSFPHDTSAFTQGLEYYKGKMYESTGLPGKSTIRQVDYTTGKPVRNKKLDSVIFAEGITIFKDTIYQLTYQNHVVFLYNLKDFSMIKKIDWSNEGWGITNDGRHLIVSEGSDKLYFVNPGDFKLQKVVSVTDNLGPVNNLNELEYINGFIYANRYQYNYILKIDPNTGHVVAKIDFTDLLKRFSKADLSYLTKEGSTGLEHGAELNGIAWDSSGMKMFVTGKLWPTLFEVKFSEQ
jgi:glutamine cyclotransferase